MPKFPGPVRHSNPDAPVLLLEENQVAGFGVFANTTERDNLPSLLQRDGYIAIVDSQGYIFNGGTWTDSGDWEPLVGIPGGNKFGVLAKQSNIDFDYGWTETPTFEQANISKWSDANNPKLLFTRSRGADHTNDETLTNDILGEIGFTGINTSNASASGGKILFTQTQSSTTATHVQSKFELFVGTSTGEQVALTANEQRVISIPNLTSPPTAVEGGLYADNTDKLYFGVS